MNTGEHFTRDDDLLEMETEEIEHDVTSNPSFKSEQFYSCDICLKVFKNESLFSEHKQTHSEPLKNKNVTVSHGVKLLESKVENQNLYVCDICALVFVTEESLVAHSESHNIALSVSSVSIAQPSSASDLNQDSLGFIAGESQGMTASKDRYPCTICHAKFHTSALLSTHVEVSHSKHFTCSHCKKKTFTSYINLTKHVRICHPKRTHSRSLQASIQLLKKRKENPRDNSVLLSVDSQKPFSTEQPQKEIKSFQLLGENQNNDPHSSIVEESVELKHDITSQVLDEVSGIEAMKNASSNLNFHRSLTNGNSVERSKECNDINAESLPIFKNKSDLIACSELEQNEYRGEGCEVQESPPSETNPIDSDRSTPNFQNNTDLLIEDFEQLRQTEMDELHDSSDMEVEIHDGNNPLGDNSCYLRDQYNIETNDLERRNCINDRSLCDAEIDFRLEDCLDVEMAKLSDSTPKPAEQLQKLESPSHYSGAPLMEQQEQGTTLSMKHSSVESEFCDETIGKYIIQNSPSCAVVLQDSPIHVMENIDKFHGNEPTESDLGHDMIAEIVGNEILSVEDSDLSESNLNSAADLLSSNDESSQHVHVPVDPVAVHKDDFRKTKDCLYSLEDALDKLEAQNTE
jgi:hypothetical protein